MLRYTDQSIAVDTDTAVKIGRLVGASALIVGNANVKYDLKRWKKKPWQDKEGKWHQSYNVKGTAKVNSTLNGYRVNYRESFSCKINT